MRAWSAVEEVVTSRPPNSRHDAGRGLHGLHDAPLVDLAVRGEGLGRGRRPDRQLDLGRVGARRRTRRPPGCAPCPARTAAIGKRTSARSFAATTRRRPAPGGERGVARAHRDVHRHLGVGLVLHHDRQLEAVAEVQEARGGGAHHERQAGDERRLAGAEAPRARRRRPPSRGSGSGCRAASPARGRGPRRRSGRSPRRARGPRSRCGRGWARGPCPPPTWPCSASSAARPSAGRRRGRHLHRPRPAAERPSATPAAAARARPAARAARATRSRWSETSAPRRA